MHAVPRTWQCCSQTMLQRHLTPGAKVRPCNLLQASDPLDSGQCTPEQTRIRPLAGGPSTHRPSRIFSKLSQGWGVTSMVERLSRKWEVLTSNPTTTTINNQIEK
jgi:hypothetical protein